MINAMTAFRRSRFREARFKTYIAPIIASLIAQKGSCRILDLGGDPDYWRFRLPEGEIRIDILNIDPKQATDDERFSFISGDARDVSQFEDQSFDFVHSNSLIEHVGRWEDIRRTANEIRRLAPRYYVQTPNFWFPIDPHSNTPMLHWLPPPMQRRMVSTRSRGFYARAQTIDQAMGIVEGTTMLDRAQVSELFPDAEVVTENFLFMTKSLIAIKAAS